MQHACFANACAHDIYHACITRQVTLPDGSSTILYVVLCGVKGDWPYLSISEALGPRMHVSVLHAFFCSSNCQENAIRYGQASQA